MSNQLNPYDTRSLDYLQSISFQPLWKNGIHVRVSRSPTMDCKKPTRLANLETEISTLIAYLSIEICHEALFVTVISNYAKRRYSNTIEQGIKERPILLAF